MARIRALFDDLASGGMGFAVDSLTATSEMHLPTYEDIADADPSVSSLAISLGQEPHGLWWHNGDQWFAGDRSKVSAVQVEVGSNESDVLAEFSMPLDMEIDVWQSQVAVVEGDNEDVSMDLYNATADETLYVHEYQEHGDKVVFGNPLTVEPVSDGDTVRVRATNDEPSGIVMSGWVLWSFQEQLTA